MSGYIDGLNDMRQVIAFIENRKDLFAKAPEGPLPQDIWSNIDKVRRLCAGFVEGHRNIAQHAYEDIMGNVPSINHFTAICRALYASGQLGSSELAKITGHCDAVKSLCSRADGWQQTVGNRQADRIDPVMMRRIERWAKGIAAHLNPAALSSGFLAGTEASAASLC